MLTLDRLKYFVEVATLQHVGQASKNASVSPSVISSAIIALEAEFGCELFMRDKGRIKLNEQGYVLLEQAKAILENINQLYTEVGGKNHGIRGHFRLGASHFLMQEYVIPAFLQIQKDHPKITADFVSLDTGVAISQILSGTLDAALVFRSSNHYDLEEQVLAEGEFHLVVKEGHSILKVSRSKLIQELNKLPAITFRASVGPNFCENHPLFTAYGIMPKHTYFYEDHQTALQLLDKTQGWAFLPDTIIHKFNGLKKVMLGKEFTASSKISFIRNKNKPSSLMIDKLRTLLAMYI